MRQWRADCGVILRIYLHQVGGFLRVDLCGFCELSRPIGLGAHPGARGVNAMGAVTGGRDVAVCQHLAILGKLLCPILE